MFWKIVVKLLVSSGLIVLVSEIGKRWTTGAAFLASLPLTSIIAMIWLYEETKDKTVISDLSRDIFWLVIPSLLLFITLPELLKRGYPFYVSLIISCAVTGIGYLALLKIIPS